MKLCKIPECDNFVKESRRGYCSNKCATLGKTKDKISNWLETGETPSNLSLRGHFIREYIYKEQDNLCSVCKTGRIWNFQYLEFIIDHIDGNSENGARSNLRMICPNCDSQLPTFKSRNWGNGRGFRRDRLNKENSGV